MKKLIFIFLFLPIFLLAQSRYYFPVSIESSSGRPYSSNVTVIAYPTGTTSNGITLTQGSGAQYYTTSEPTSQAYDVYVNGISHLTKIWWVTPESAYPDGSVGTDELADSSITSAKISDGVLRTDDSTSIKLIQNASVGDVVYMKQISSTNDIGGGHFVYIDSSYSEIYWPPSASGNSGSGGVGVVYPAYTQGYQWVRQEWLKDKNMLYSEWAGVRSGSADTTAAIASSNTTIMRRLLASRRTAVLSPGVTWIDSTIYIRSDTKLISLSRWRSSSAPLEARIKLRAHSNCDILKTWQTAPYRYGDTGSDTQHFIQIIGVNFDGNKANQDSTNLAGIVYSSTGWQNRIEEVGITNTTGFGVILGDTSSVTGTGGGEICYLQKLNISSCDSAAIHWVDDDAGTVIIQQLKVDGCKNTLKLSGGYNYQTNTVVLKDSRIEVGTTQNDGVVFDNWGGKFVADNIRFFNNSGSVKNGYAFRILNTGSDFDQITLRDIIYNDISGQYPAFLGMFSDDIADYQLTNQFVNTFQYKRSYPVGTYGNYRENTFVITGSYITNSYNQTATTSESGTYRFYNISSDTVLADIKAYTGSATDKGNLRFYLNDGATPNVLQNQMELQDDGDVYVGNSGKFYFSTGSAGIDSAKVVSDTLKFYIGSTEYNAFVKGATSP